MTAEQGSPTTEVERLRQQNHDAAVERDRKNAAMERELARCRNAYQRAKELVRGSPVDWSKEADGKPDGWWGYTSQNNRDIVAAAISEARQQALTDAIAAVDDVRFQFAAFPGDGADGDGPLGQLMAAVIDTLTRLRDGSEEATRP